MSGSSNNKQEFIRECIAKATFLSRFGLIACIIFIVIVLKLYPDWQASKTLFFFSIGMIIISLGFFLLMKKATNVLGSNPSDEEILKWGNFLELYYVPKYFTRKKKNPYIIEDDED
jgi:preprotein translocase subunit SecG